MVKGVTVTSSIITISGQTAELAPGVMEQEQVSLSPEKSNPEQEVKFEIKNDNKKRRYCSIFACVLCIITVVISIAIVIGYTASKNSPVDDSYARLHITEAKKEFDNQMVEV